MSDHEERRSQLETRSRVSASHKSSRASSRTSVSAAATKARAKAEAAKIKVSFAEKEAAMMKEKASIEASLHMLKQDKEATAASREAAIFEKAAAAVEYGEKDTLGELQDLALEDPIKRTKDYIETQQFDTHAPPELQDAMLLPPILCHETVKTRPSYSPSENMKKSYNLSWEADYMRYLGVNIPADLSKLFSLNVVPLNNKIGEDIRRWDLIPFLNFGSRIESVKMVVLPRLLYLFQSLPLDIPDHQFQEWDKLISRYIWQGRRPRIKYKNLQLAKIKGGVALPCLKDYYIAAQLRPLVCWCNPDYRARWKELEVAITAEFPIQVAIGDNDLMKKLIDHGNPWIAAPLKLWIKVITRKNLKEAIKVLRWCAFDPHFMPKNLDARFKAWKTHGLTSYCTFLSKGSMNSFQNLKRQFGLNNDDFFRFLQVRHHVEQMIKEIKQEQGENILLKVFMDAYVSGSGQKTISRLYKGLQQMKDSSLQVKQKWEREGNFVISEDDWEYLCEKQWKTSNSTLWREFY